MSHFSIGYQPEEGSGRLFNLASNKSSHSAFQPLSTREKPDLRSYFKTYLSMIRPTAVPMVFGLTK